MVFSGNIKLYISHKMSNFVDFIIGVRSDDKFY